MTLFSFEEINVSKLANAIRKPDNSKGPKGYEPKNLIYSLIAMQVEKIQSTKDLVAKLNKDPVLRYCCDFKVLGRVPSESTFSRFLNKLSDSEELEQLFHELVIAAKEISIINGEHISIDSTKLNSYEAAKPKKDIIDDDTNHNGNNIRRFGWKLHILCDSKSELPLDISVTPAGTHDGTVAIPLIAGTIAINKTTSSNKAA